MSWINKKKSSGAPWFEKKNTKPGKQFKNLNKDDSTISELNSKLKARLEAFEKEREEQPQQESDKVLYSEEIQNIRIHGLEKRFAEPEEGRIFVLGYPYKANVTDDPGHHENEQVQSKPKKTTNLYDLQQSTLNANIKEDIAEKESAAEKTTSTKIEVGDDGSWLMSAPELDYAHSNKAVSYDYPSSQTKQDDFEILDQDTGIAEAKDDEVIFNKPNSLKITQLDDEEIELATESNENEDETVKVALMPLLKSKDEGEMASITPVVEIEEQYSIEFQVLKTSHKHANLLDPKESQRVITTLEETLAQFGIEGRVMGIQRGPIITRYEIKMAPGIKVSRILGLSDELAMALEAVRVRIEAPIPGRSTVGIEIPNRKRASVLLGDILNDPAYKEFEGELPLPLGKDIAGNLMLADLVKLPHLLIAGATGSGKSVSVNSFITNLIMNKSPEQVRLLLVDPKLVELSHFNDIPHLLHPVITEPAKAIQALSWAVEEMERRYEDMAELRARDIRTFNEKVEKQNTKNRERKGKKRLYKMPYIICLIDELGDLMMVAGKEVEASIIRLSQKARAVGIHLILATQRPSVDVITALIKANCPARIALQVAQKTDSRTILDGNGAEQLLGSGDLLFKHPSKPQLIRIQAPLITDDEVEAVVKNAKELGKPKYIKLEDPKGKAGAVSEEDEALFEEAWGIILESGKASASYLQRRLRIGYNRAARLIEAFEARGLIGPPNWFKTPRNFGQLGPNR